MMTYESGLVQKDICKKPLTATSIGRFSFVW